MSKFNTPGFKAPNQATGPVRTKSKAMQTHEGGAGFKRGKRSELFLLAVSNFVGEDTFYETAGTRDDRFTALVGELAVKDPAWTADLLRWLRGPEANLRSASVVGAAEYVRARLAAGLHGDNRKVVDSVLQRADEPGELLAYWVSRYGYPAGRTPGKDGKMPTAPVIPQPIKRGVADAVMRLYNEKSLLKYDTASHGFRFGDVIDLVHPIADPGKPWQGELFKHALDRRHNRDNEIPELLKTIRMNAAFKQTTPAAVDEIAERGALADSLREAGMTWEQLGSLGPWNATRWEAMIPTMGYMALLRNLRNFDQAGVSDEVAATVAAKLANPDEVARSRQLPMRFLSAFNAAPSLRWSWPLEQALEHSLGNIAALPGRTLLLVDTSGSMNAGFSKDGSLHRWDAATLFGLAVARRAEKADIVSFADAYNGWHMGTRYDISSPSKEFDLRTGESLLSALRRWKSEGFFLGGGTDTIGAVRRHFDGHDRVLILTDEQHSGSGSVGAALPDSVPLYTWNLAGYRAAQTQSGPNRHTFAGLTDAGFRIVPLLESGRVGNWPWVA